MPGVPIFIEMPGAAEVNICGRTVDMLMQLGIQPVGYAANLEELETISAQLAENALQPSIFVVNTYTAKDLIPELDRIMGESPVLFLRRGMYAGQSGLMDHLAVAGASTTSTMTALDKMRPRLTSVWLYGGKNADQVCSKIVRCMQKFVVDNNFRHFEIANQVGGDANP